MYVEPEFKAIGRTSVVRDGPYQKVQINETSKIRRDKQTLNPPIDPGISVAPLFGYRYATTGFTLLIG